MNPREAVKLPAMALMLVSALSIVACGLALVADVIIFARGLEPDYVAVAIRVAWTIVLVMTSTIALAGGKAMLDTSRRSLAMTGAVLAVIPCLSPCVCIGVPFGVWALVVLAKPEVKAAFR